MPSLDGEERIFRLYFVDAPESALTYPERLQEQAEYFGIRPVTGNATLRILGVGAE